MYYVLERKGIGFFWENKSTVFKVFFDSDMLHCEADLKMRMNFGNDISVSPVGVICLPKNCRF